jgi:hypothetical protein
LNPIPDAKRVERIIDALDIDGNGVIAPYEVKILLSRLMKVAVQEIPDDHKEVLAFAGLEKWAMVAKICGMVRKSQIDRYFEAMFPEEAAAEPCAAARKF